MIRNFFAVIVTINFEASLSSTGLVCTLLQDFPYYVEEGISHDNIWSTTPLSTEQLIEVGSSMSHTAE